MDALLHISRHVDRSLAFRVSCQSGLCLACLIRIDGRNQCPCRTVLGQQMVLEPLKNRKIIRDLVVEEEQLNEPEAGARKVDPIKVEK